MMKKFLIFFLKKQNFNSQDIKNNVLHYAVEFTV